jgi:hypothetical protein
MARPYNYNKPVMTPLQVQMHLSSLSKEEITALLIDSISRLEMKEFIFQNWKDGNTLKRYNIERHLRKSSNDEREKK